MYQQGQVFDPSQVGGDFLDVLKKYSGVGMAGRAIGEGAGRLHQAYAAHQQGINDQRNRFASGARRQPEMPPRIKPADAAALQGYGLSALDSAGPMATGAPSAPTMPPAPYNASAPVSPQKRAQQNPQVTQNPPTTSGNYVGDLPVDPQAGTPAITKGLFDQPAAMRNAEMDFAMGMGGMGAAQSDAERQMKYADDWGGVDNKRMDWASQMARALRMGGAGFERARAQGAYDESRRGQAGQLQKMKYAIERIRRNQDPESVDLDAIDRQGY
jgi:hypothetical protein